MPAQSCDSFAETAIHSPIEAQHLFEQHREISLRLPISTFGARRFAPRQPIFEEGEHDGTLYEIVEGLVLLSRTLSDGRRQVLELFGPGMLLGLVHGQTARARAEALSNVRLQVIERERLERSERLQRLANKQLQASVMALSDLAIMLGRKTAPERIAAFLLQLARAAGKLMDDEPPSAPIDCALFLTQADIGDYLGLSVETVCRELAKMKQAGLIKLDRKGSLRIADAAALARHAEQPFPPYPSRPAQARMRKRKDENQPSMRGKAA